METINNEYQIVSGQALVTKTEDALKDLKRYVNEKNWRININVSSVKISLDTISKFSWNRTKNYNKALRKLNGKRSIRSINTALHYIFKRLLETDTRVKVKVSDKEEKIQTYRKEWIKARNTSEELLEKYKTEKGNFYKV